MKRKILSILIVLSVFVTIAQQRESRQIENFSEISVSQAITVELTQGSSPSLVVEVDGTDIENVITEVRGGRLNIEMEDKWNGYRNVDVAVYVTYVALEEIEVSSAANVYGEGTISADKLEIEVSSAGDCEIDIDVNELEASVSSAGDLELSGKAIAQYVKVSSSGDYDAFDLVSEQADVDASSAGDARIYVTEKLNADATSGASVVYKGKPSRVYSDSNSGGKVRGS